MGLTNLLTIRIQAMGTEEEFKDWLSKELNKRDWIPAQLAKASGVGADVISRILSGDSGGRCDTLVQIAKGLNLPPELVLSKAGIIPRLPEGSEEIKEFLYLFSKYPGDEKEELLAYMRFMIDNFKKQGKIKNDI